MKQLNLETCRIKSKYGMIRQVLCFEKFCIRKPFLLGYVVKVVHRSMDA